MHADAGSGKAKHHHNDQCVHRLVLERFQNPGRIYALGHWFDVRSRLKLHWSKDFLAIPTP